MAKALTIEGAFREVLTGFDYSALEARDATAARAAASRIRERTAKAVAGLMEIGSDLISMKARLDHGQFTAWATAELGMTMRSVQRYDVAEVIDPRGCG